LALRDDVETTKHVIASDVVARRSISINAKQSTLPQAAKIKQSSAAGAHKSP
jgi:hypothetical protein